MNALDTFDASATSSKLAPSLILPDAEVLELPSDFPRRRVTHRAAERETHRVSVQLGECAWLSCWIVFVSRLAGRSRFPFRFGFAWDKASWGFRASLQPNATLREIGEQFVDQLIEMRDRPPLSMRSDVDSNAPDRLSLPIGFSLVRKSTLVSAEGALLSSGGVDVELAFGVVLGDDETHLVLDYQTHLWRPSTIRHWLMIVASLAERFEALADTPWEQLPWLGADARHEILETWNETSPEHKQFLPAHPKDPACCLHRLFEAQVERTPGAMAIVFGDDQWTYETLNRRANGLAKRLQRSGVGPDQRVGVFVERGPGMLLAILAIHKAGGAYVPMDPAFPADRLQMIGEDAGIKIIVTESTLSGLLSLEDAEEILVEDYCEGEGCEVAGTTSVHASHLAYVIYTSGSTGKPKGVEIEHRTAVNYVRAVAETPGLKPGELMLAMTTMSFDISVTEFFMPLACGATVVIAPRGLSADGESLRMMLGERQISLIQGTPTTFRLLLEYGWTGQAGLKVMVGGEPVPRDLANALIQLGCEVWNFYGPTETTVWSSYQKLEDAETPVLIGRPVANNRLYVLDSDRQPVPAGVVGDIFIGGESLARGYANRPELTAEKFVSDPFVEVPGARMYDTGDRGRWTADGVLECLGRSDNQVKIRGYRIELGEIESTLKAQPSVKDAVVAVREDTPGDQQLVAYVIPNGSLAPESQLREALQATLPSYMVPSVYHAMTVFPKTPSQKVDRKALPAPASDVSAVDIDEETTVEAHDWERGSVEETIIAIWESVLKRKGIRRGDHFFQLGGHSVHVARVHAQLKEHFEKPITVAQLFQYATVAQLAAYYEHAETGRVRRAQPRERTATADIAIIGMAGRFPGAESVEAFWENIRNGVESIQEFTKEELAARGVAAVDYEDPSYVRRGTVLERADHFDAEFFGMSPREAELTNPQHRLFLQTVWEALEHAGYVPERYQGDIGLYAGSGHNSYLHAHRGLSGMDYVQVLVGNEQDYLTTRTAFKLGLTGPALNTQTACSTSLVAVHQACEALMAGECSLAVAGGVSVSWPDAGYKHEKGLIFSSDGRCRAFDAKADGTVFSQGLGLVVMKPLEKALADGDTVHAVIRGTAINNDGARKGGFSAPSIEGQAEVIREALEKQAISAESVSYVEAHGTGTAVGDPIEIQGLTQAYRMDTDKKAFCALGSVKTNIGHTDAAAGIAGLLKVVQSLKHRELAPSLHFESPNPELDLENSPFRVQTRLEEWQCEGPRRAALSSFGLGGTNAHAVIEEAPTLALTSPSRPFQLLPLSGRTTDAVDALRQRWSAFLASLDSPESFADSIYTAQIGRASFAERRFVVAPDATSMATLLDKGECQGGKLAALPRRVVFLFSGQGAQYEGMGRGTYLSEPVFAEALDQCSALLEVPLGFRLTEALYPVEGASEK